MNSGNELNVLKVNIIIVEMFYKEKEHPKCIITWAYFNMILKLNDFLKLKHKPTLIHENLHEFNFKTF